MVKTYSLYLSTLTATGQYVPTNKTNLANVFFNVNWRDVFSPDDEGKPMRVKVRMLSRNVLAASSPWDTSIGTIRCNLPDKNSNSTNGLILALTYWEGNPTAGNSNHIIDVNTLSDNGVESYVPIGTQNFNIKILDLAETHLASANVAEYNILFIFEIDE